MAAVKAGRAIEPEIGRIAGGGAVKIGACHERHLCNHRITAVYEFLQHHMRTSYEWPRHTNARGSCVNTLNRAKGCLSGVNVALSTEVMPISIIQCSTSTTWVRCITLMDYLAFMTKYLACTVDLPEDTVRL
eukprot:6213054-Pleurochrysis_carterae.AAC.2